MTEQLVYRGIPYKQGKEDTKKKKEIKFSYRWNQYTALG